VYMALGEMFRSRGEIGRAVRIHQNLLARPDLPQSMHLQAHVALAIDFQTGGLLDRALGQYQKALDMQSDHAVALEACLRIREQSSEWLLAEELLSRLERVRDASYGLHRAYLFAEMARQSLQQGDVEAAYQDALRAIELDAACAPARMVEIDLLLQQGLQQQDRQQQDLQQQGHDVAKEKLYLLWQQAREHFPLVIPSLLQHDTFYQTHAVHVLRELWLESQDSELILAWIEALVQTSCRTQAQALCDELAYSPTSLRQSLRLNAALGKPDDVHTGFARQWRKTAKNYACEQCGVEVVEVRWQCPQCHAWGTLHSKSEEKI